MSDPDYPLGPLRFCLVGDSDHKSMRPVKMCDEVTTQPVVVGVGRIPVAVRMDGDPEEDVVKEGARAEAGDGAVIGEVDGAEEER
jgi:hypothetical protein